MGRTPISFTEIDSWSKLTATEVSHWEAQTMRTLSADYAVQSQKNDKGESPPYASTQHIRNKHEARLFKKSMGQ